MGSANSFKKDQKVDIFAQISKPFYRAGEQLEGNIYLNVKEQTSYNALYLRFQGLQYCHWSQGSGKNRRSYSNKMKTYEQQFIVSKYDNGFLYPGNYTFPFCFVLPLTMSGSFEYSTSNYIKYTLSAYLTSFEKKNDNQVYQLSVNVRQIPKIPFGSAYRQRDIEGKCCSCCMSYGRSKISIQCDKNIVNTGQRINVSAKIDNSQGSKQIQNVRLTLEKRHIMVSNGGHVTYRFSQSHFLNNFITKTVAPGATQTFDSKPIIPIGQKRETCTGAVTAIWFQLTIQGDLGCCNYDQPKASVQLFVYSSNLQIVANKKVDPPTYWSPIVSPVIFYQGMKPFMYQPCQQLAFATLNNNILKPINDPNFGINQGIKPSFNNNSNNDYNQDYLNDPYQSNKMQNKNY